MSEQLTEKYGAYFPQEVSDTLGIDVMRGGQGAKLE